LNSTAKIFQKKMKIVTIVRRTLKRKKSFKSSSREIDETSKQLWLKNVANNEDLALKNWIKNVSNKKSTFIVSFLELRIVLLILQRSDSLTQRVRSLAQKASMTHDERNDDANRQKSNVNAKTLSNDIRREIELDSFFKWNIENDLLRWKNKWYILSRFFKRKLLKQNHDDSFAKHFEHKRTLNLLKRKYFWFNMNKNVKKYVDLCSTCHWIKIVRHKSHEMLQSFSLSEDSRQDWTMNFIIDLSSSKHKDIVHDSILIIMNRYIKFNLYILAKKIWNAEHLIDALIDEVFIKFEKLVFIITNRDFLFIFKFWSFFCYHLWIWLWYSIVYYSQIDEQIEKQN
jgi:hypothetical protein